MTSEIRVNKLENRVGLGTIEYSNTGPVISGVTTASNFKTGSSNLHSSGVEVAGVNVLGADTPIGLGATIYNSGAAVFTGVVTATSFSGPYNGTDIVGTGLTLTSTDTGSSAGPELKLFRNSASPADADYLGQIKFAAESDTGVERNYAKITGKILDASNGTEDGIIEFAHIKGGSQTITGRWRSDSLQLLNSTNFSVAGNAEITGTTTLTNDLNVDSGTLFVDVSSNRIGINQSSPSTNLDVVGNSSISGGLTVSSNLTVSGTCNLGQTVSITGTNPRLQFVDTNHNSDYSIYGSNGRFTIYDDTNSAERFKMESTGFVNIGTGTAQQQLTVQNSAQHSLIRVISNTTSDTGVDFGDTADGDIGRIRYSNNGDYMTFRVNNINAVRFDSSGRVQIGGGNSPTQVGDGSLIVYSTDRLHPSIKCAGMSNNYANGYTLLGDNYLADESQINLGVSYSSSSLVLSRGVKVSGSADDTYLSSQDSYSMRPSAVVMDSLGAFNFLTTETNATTTTDSAVSLTKVFTIDRVGNIYQRTSARSMYFGDSQQLRIGVQGNGDSNIEAVSGDLKIMDGGSVITQVRSDGLENFQHVYPANDNSKDLGKSTKRWANIYTTDLHLSNEGKSNVVDGTWGDWTLQEGENKIFMINNRTGKKYSLKMEEE